MSDDRGPASDPPEGSVAGDTGAPADGPLLAEPTGGEPPATIAVLPPDSSGSADRRPRSDFLREVTTMALYVSLSLLAVLLALPDADDEDNRVQEGLVVLGTGLGLVLAHHVAFRMSTRLVNEGLLTGESVEAMRAQALGGIPVALLAALPVFLLGEDPGEDVAVLLLLLLVLGVGYRTARFSSRRVRALASAAVLVLVVAAVVGIKLIAGH
jgi:hypothetical protein